MYFAFKWTHREVNSRVCTGRLAFWRSGENELAEERKRALKYLAYHSYPHSALVAAAVRAYRIQRNRSWL